MVRPDDDHPLHNDYDDWPHNDPCPYHFFDHHDGCPYCPHHIDDEPAEWVDAILRGLQRRHDRGLH